MQLLYSFVDFLSSNVMDYLYLLNVFDYCGEDSSTSVGRAGSAGWESGDEMQFLPSYTVDE